MMMMIMIMMEPINNKSSSWSRQERGKEFLIEIAVAHECTLGKSSQNRES